jgi:molybdopterin molybdotransferase
VTSSPHETARLSWHAARQGAYAVGRAAQLKPRMLPLAECDGTTLAEDLRAMTDIPPFPTSCVDGFAIRSAGPWRIRRRILAGETAPDIGSDGEGIEIATGAMVPADTDAIIRIEDSVITSELVSGAPRPKKEWRITGEEARRDAVLTTAGTPVTPAIIGLAAASGHDRLTVRPRPLAALVVCGDELLTSGIPGNGRIRDALGPQIPGWLRRLGIRVTTPSMTGPVADTLEDHVTAIVQAQASGADIIVTTGGTMHGPADFLHTALQKLDATYAVNTVEVRPGKPMLLASLDDPRGRRTLVAGLPGNPQPAVLALITLVGPAMLGLTGRPLPELPLIELGAPILGRGQCAHLALVRHDSEGRAHPLGHTAPATMRGLALAAGFAAIAPGQSGKAGDHVPFASLPIWPGEHA